MNKYIKINEDRLISVEQIKAIYINADESDITNAVRPHLSFDIGQACIYVTPELSVPDQESLLIRIEQFLLDDEERGLRIIVRGSWRIDTENPPEPEDEGDTDYGPGNGSLSCGYDDAIKNSPPPEGIGEVAGGFSGPAEDDLPAGGPVEMDPFTYGTLYMVTPQGKYGPVKLPEGVNLRDLLNNYHASPPVDAVITSDLWRGCATIEELKELRASEIQQAEWLGREDAFAEAKEAGRHVGDGKGRVASVNKVRADRWAARDAGGTMIDSMPDINAEIIAFNRGLTTPQQAAGISLQEMTNITQKPLPPEGRVTIAEQMAYNSPEAKAARREVLDDLVSEIKAGKKKTPEIELTPGLTSRGNRLRNKARENRNKPPVFKKGGPNRC